jgi:hypothetical protein
VKRDIVSSHGKTREQFVAALVDAYVMTGLTPRTATLRLGAAVYPLLLRSEIDGPHTTLPGVGWFGIELDPALEPWSGCFVEKEKV